MEISQAKHSDPSDIQEKESSPEKNLEKDETEDTLEEGDDGKDETESLNSTESGELVERLKRKRVEEDDEGKQSYVILAFMLKLPLINLCDLYFLTLYLYFSLKIMCIRY